VEFALVVPILIFLLFGIIDYGLYFTNSLAVRAGASDAARQIIVGNFSTTCSGAFAATGPGSALVSKVENCVSPVAGTVDAKVTYGTWAPGQNVRVCAVVDVDGLTGLTPMPAAGRVTARVVVPIQQPVAPSSTPPGPDNPGWFSGWCD
jgi:Flp pilus assembly protein TadG